MESTRFLRENLNRLLDERGINGTDLAKASVRHGKISQKVISNILREDLDSYSPTLRTVEIAAKTLGVPIRDLILDPSKPEAKSEKTLENALYVTALHLFESELLTKDEHDMLKSKAFLISYAVKQVLTNDKADEQKKFISGMVSFLLDKIK